jgi:Clostripain family
MAVMKKFTLMFYFASDNPLAPSVISQLKAIKQAGYHPDANVVAHFDPHSVGTPTHVFDVNLIERLGNPGRPNIGFPSNDPFVRNLLEDKLWRDQKCRDEQTLVKDRLADILGRKERPVAYVAPKPPDGKTAVAPALADAGRGNGHGGNGGGGHGRGRKEEASPQDSLHEFLKFCVDEYPAEHYMLIILGHGLVVGNDIFLYDEHAEKHSLTLKGLKAELKTFRDAVVDKGGRFDLLGLHSCSVSALEVAYEMEGTADYMLASQGPAFVSSWPYRQMLIRVFNDLEYFKKGKRIDIEEMLVRIFKYCYHNSTDFLLAGYSFDITLCDLRRVRELTLGPVGALAKALTAGLADPLVRDFILLAHWRSQSYWQENYTDLFDFCHCLRKQCKDFKVSAGRPMTERMAAVYAACERVKELFDDGAGLVVRSDFAGPAYQYSHGLSVYFPWTEPPSDSKLWSRDDDGKLAGEYKDYDFKETLWFKFLEKYFVKTRRKSRRSESGGAASDLIVRGLSQLEQDEAELIEDMVSLVYNEEGRLSMDTALTGGKTNPVDGTGEDCACPVIKNFPRDTRARADRGLQANAEVTPISRSFALKSSDLEP